MKLVFESIQHLLTSGAVMAIGAAVIKYKAFSLTSSTANVVAGLIVIIIGFGLSLWAWLYYLSKTLKELKSKWGALLTSFFYFYIWAIMLTVLFYMAFDNA